MVTITVSGVKHLTPRTAFDDAAIQILHEFEVAEHRTLQTAGQTAHELSSGTATTRMLATPVAAGGHGHPYGHGPVGSLGPRGEIPNGGDPGVINIQTGEFAAGWEESYGHFIGNTAVQVLFNETEHAQLIEDTPDELQIERPIVKRIEHIIGQVRQLNLEHAIQEINRI